MNLEIFQAWTFVLPIFSVFESIYMRAATKHGHTKAPEKNQGHPTIENVTFDEFKKEHHEFEKRLKSEHNLDGDQLNTILDNYGLNYRAAQRFYNYFEGKKLSDGLEPEDDEDQDEEFYPPSDLGSCANILGCTFNLTPVSEFVNGNRELLIHKEHSRPNSNFGSDADQKMCAPHNFAKGENKIFDVFGLFYCATGKNLR